MRRGNAITLMGLCAFTLAGATGVLGYSLRPTESPELLAAAAIERSAPVVSQPFDDTRKVQVRVVTSDADALIVHAGGTLTNSSCTDGGSIASGEVLARVDDRLVIALHTSVPLHRDLARGAKGLDVEALQSELVRLGHLPASSANGEYGWTTSKAIQRMRSASGAPQGDGVVQRADFAWLRVPEVTGLACEVRVGHGVGGGTVFANAEGAILRLEIESMPASLTPGARSLTVNGATGPVLENGVLDDPDTLAHLATDSRLIGALRADPEMTLTGDLALTGRIDAYTVPVGAIIEDGNRYCVQTGRTTQLVDLLGSVLGSAVISFVGSENAAPGSVHVGTAVTEATCDA